MIKLLKNEKDLFSFHQKNQKKTIGFVATMGNLHDGHMSLLKKSLEETDISMISIFVNPTQFGVNEDLSSYPRTLEQDLDKINHLAKLNPEKEIFVFYPESDKVIYPQEFNDFVSIEELNKILEGKIRPTHFDGVATVVKRLFKLILPQKAYFGKKDYQQLKIIQKMVEQEKMDIDIIGLPIVREKDGLAMSSRNSYLTAEERQNATTLYKTLQNITECLKENGWQQAISLAKKIENDDNRFNYLEIRSCRTLSPITHEDKELVILGNLQLGATRLLDNIEVKL